MMTARQARRVLVRQEAHLAATERQRDSAALDAAALQVAARCAFVALSEMEAGITPAGKPAEFMAIADRHAATPLFTHWRARSEGGIAAAREAEDAIATASEEADARLLAASARAGAELEHFAATALGLLRTHAGIAALFAGAISAAGVIAADEPPHQTVIRLRRWLTGRGVALTSLPEPFHA